MRPEAAGGQGCPVLPWSPVRVPPRPLGRLDKYQMNENALAWIGLPPEANTAQLLSAEDAAAPFCFMRVSRAAHKNHDRWGNGGTESPDRGLS